MYYRLLPLIALALLLCGCSTGQLLSTEPVQPIAFPLSLPQGKLASATDLAQDGSAYLMSSDQGVSTDGTTAVLDASELDLAYVVYGVQLPAGHELQGIDVTLDQPDTEFWLAYSDYGVTNRWELHGPYDAESPVPLKMAMTLDTAPNYVNGSGYTYWAVIVGRPHSVHVVSSTVHTSAPPILEKPPAGDYTADSASSLYPDLVLVPEDGWLGEAGAPLIAYTSFNDTAPELYLAYYNGGDWQTKHIDTEHNLLQPHVLLTADGIRLIAQVPLTGDFYDYLLDNQLEVTNTATFPGKTGTPLFISAADVHNFGDAEAPFEEILVAAAYSGDSHSELWLMSWTKAGGWESAHDPLTFDDRITGATMAFNPVTGNPMAIIAHGILDTSSTLLIDTSLQVAKREDAVWSLSDEDVVVGTTNQAPMGLDLGFMEDGTPQLVAVAARDFTFLTFSASLYFDVTVGKPDGDSWTFERAFTSSVDAQPIIPPLPPTEVDVTLSIAPMASWARPNGLIHFLVNGDAIVDIGTQQPTGGTIDSETQYRSKPTVAWTVDDYYTGSSGIQFCFGDYHVGGGCAYIKASALDFNDIMGGNFVLQNELRYWSPD